MENYSISRIKQYDTCRLAYYLKYFLKIRKPYEAHPSAVFGNLVHWAAEHDVYDIDKVRQEAKKKEYVKIKKSDLGIELKRNIKAIQEYKKQDNKDFPKQQEEQWLKWQGKNFKFCGKVDRILYNDVICKVVDYKSNSKVNVASEYDSQLKFYNMLLLLGGTTGNRKIISELFFTRHNVTVCQEFSKKEIFDFVKETKEKIVKIENTKKWLPQASFSNCMFCDYKHDKKLCQASKCR